MFLDASQEEEVTERACSVCSTRLARTSRSGCISRNAVGRRKKQKMLEYLGRVI
jgi:hypothetical protein